MKKVLGLDLGTTSIGWALVNQSESKEETSAILKSGVRVNPLTVDEKGQFEKGKSITTNADRTLKRSMRRNLQRFKLRRDSLVNIFLREGWANSPLELTESGPGTTFETLHLRAKAPVEEISLTQLARVLLQINKKRGYKSSRKAAADEDGQLMDGIAVAKILKEKNLTPGQYGFELLRQNKKTLPDFYLSDIKDEFNKIWGFQKQFYPELLTDELKELIEKQTGKGTSQLLYAKCGIATADNKGGDRLQTRYGWRKHALDGRIEKEVLAYVLMDLRSEISNSSGYLNSISDNSKILYFNDMTIGQLLCQIIENNPNESLKNKVFYRQDYQNEFDKIWDFQSKFHPEMSEGLRNEIRNNCIFYQRRLKSQKGLISFCEFERRKVQVEIDGNIKEKMRGCRVAPRSSLLFQEFKIWQTLNNVQICQRRSDASRYLTETEKDILAGELAIHSEIKASDVLKILKLDAKTYTLNYKVLDGNKTMSTIYEKFLRIVELSGHGKYELNKVFDKSYIISLIEEIFAGLGFNKEILNYDSSLPKEAYEQQPLFKLWHLLYSYEGDNSSTGDQSLVKKIAELCRMPEEYAKIIAEAHFLDDYASLSHKAMRKILPFLKAGNQYDMACMYAGYNHSHSMTAEERDSKPLLDSIPNIPKGELRNPVVEKIINQMINVVNAIGQRYGKPDEIHIEMARELKQTRQQREQATKAIESATKESIKITEILKKEFGLSYVSKNDIIKYRLYEELRENGYKSLYSNTYISRNQLFNGEVDIEHIIPQALVYDDSFSNKTLEFRDINLAKGKKTAYDFVAEKYNIEEYKNRVIELWNKGSISEAKKNKLFLPVSKVDTGFINRDLTNSQYIAKKAKEILESYVHKVVPTSGTITSILREQWQLENVMKEMNLPKYDKLGMVRYENRAGKLIPKIDEWSKRNDHRHHAMDAITIAFTQPVHIQLINSVNADDNPESTKFRLENMTKVGNKKILTPPMPLDDLRQAFKDSLSDIIVSIKAKNKVATKNINTSKAKGKSIKKDVLTPRGSLHKETVYGLRKQAEYYSVKVGAKMTADVIENIVDRQERFALRERLLKFGGDAKKAFSGANSLKKNPILINSRELQEEIKCVRYLDVLSVRKPVNGDLNIEKVADPKVKEILLQRVKEFGGDVKKAFTDIDNNPIWLNKEQGIKIKRVSILEKCNPNTITSLHTSPNDKPIDFVKMGSNHHVAIYQNTVTGEYIEHVVSFYEAMSRKLLGLPIVDREYGKAIGLSFITSMKINEMFVFPDDKKGFYPEEMNLTDPANYSIISEHLFRVQKLSSNDYSFRHHLETEIKDTKQLQNITWKRILSPKDLKGAVKVRVNHIGEIVAVGEYD